VLGAYDRTDHVSGIVLTRATIETIAANASTILASPATPITTTASDNMRRMFEGFRPV
jgi:hypothetical protein